MARQPNEEDMSNEMREFMKKLKEAMEQMKSDSGLKDDFFKMLEENRRGGRPVESLKELRSLRVYGDDRIKSVEPNVMAIEFIIINGINSFLFESRTQDKRNEKLNLLYKELYNYYTQSNQVGTNEYTLDNINFLLEYYSEIEEYENCIELMNVKTTFLTLFPEQNINDENKN